MTTVAFTIPAPLQPGIPGRRQVTVAVLGSIADPLTLPITSPEVEFTDLAGNWIETPRPARKPLLIRAGDKLAKMKLTVHVVGQNPDDAAGCEFVLKVLAAYGQELNPLIVSYGTLESDAYITAAGVWRLTELTPKSMMRQPGTNSITQADVTLMFTEASDPATPAGLASRSAPPASPGPPPAGAPPGAPPSGTRSYTVLAGDTLWAISTRFYGTGIRWRDIATANNIADLRTIAPGQILQIP